ncbi:MAG: adenylate/guanylate cyclase domain-containing protein [Acetobacteraceae bacterium]
MSFSLPPWSVGLLVFAAALAIWAPDIGGIRAQLRESMLDRLLPWASPAEPTRRSVTIVDIDRAALARLGPWPWPRTTLANVVAAIADGRPASIGIDILLTGPDRFSADGDARLAQAMEPSAVVLGFVLDSAGGGDAVPVTPVLARVQSNLPGIWRAASVIGPAAVLSDAAAGFGALVAAADPDGPIRRVPLLVVAGGAVRASLAVETVLRAHRGSTLLIEAGNRLHVGNSAVPLGSDAQLRLIPPLEHWAARTIPVTALLDRAGSRAALAGQIVLLGSSAPELGGLRVTAGAPATPSVRLHAEAAAAILSSGYPVRPFWAGEAELAGALLLGGLVLLLAARLRPTPAAALALLLGGGWVIASAAAARAGALLLDPAGPPALAALCFTVTAMARFARDEWRARLLRARFEQRLAPDVVRRIAADPSALRLQGEMREVTALFTDIEGFTSMTERAAPVDLVALMDAYIDSTTSVITDHGGMIRQIMGDAVHGIYNAPFALADHPQRAIDSAVALLRASEELRRTPLGQRLQLGRTRIGIETGPAIVGDIGGGRVLDYAALGNAVNAAARLEAANKLFGSSICIGPGTAARLDPATIRRLGQLVPRGQSHEITVYTLVDLAGRPLPRQTADQPDTA